MTKPDTETHASLPKVTPMTPAEWDVWVGAYSTERVRLRFQEKQTLDGMSHIELARKAAWAAVEAVEGYRLLLEEDDADELFCCTTEGAAG